MQVCQAIDYLGFARSLAWEKTGIMALKCPFVVYSTFMNMKGPEVIIRSYTGDFIRIPSLIQSSPSSLSQPHYRSEHFFPSMTTFCPFGILIVSLSPRSVCSCILNSVTRLVNASSYLYLLSPVFR